MGVVDTHNGVNETIYEWDDATVSLDARLRAMQGMIYKRPPTLPSTGATVKSAGYGGHPPIFA